MARLCCSMSVVMAMAACAGTPLPPREMHGPANPDAPESKPLPLSTALAREASPGTPGAEPHPAASEQHEGHTGGGNDRQRPPAAEYTCPMHPEISQPEPGRCPKCGMPLEARSEAAKPGPSTKPKPDAHGGHQQHEPQDHGGHR